MRSIVLFLTSCLVVRCQGRQRGSLSLISRNLQLRHRHAYFLLTAQDPARFPRGGSDEASFNTPVVSINEQNELPSSLAGASLVAFNGPTKHPTHHHRGHNPATTSNTAAAEDPALAASDEPVDAELQAIPNVKPMAVHQPNPLLANFLERLLPALLMLGGVGALAHYFQEDGLIFLTLLLQGGMYQEMTRVVGGDFPNPLYKWWWFVTASVAFNAPRMMPWAEVELSAVVYGMAVIGLVASIVQFQSKQAGVDEFRDFLRQGAVSLLSLFLVVLPSSFWISTLEDFGMEWLWISAALVIVNDTMAYIFGMLLGKRPLIPAISPKKTWEGWLGASVSTFAAAYYASSLLPILSKRDAIVLASAASLVAPFGGFWASVLKRAYNQKDFGSLFPGHGGFVDRLDCQLMMAPLVYLYLTLSRNGINQSTMELLSKLKFIKGETP